MDHLNYHLGISALVTFIFLGFVLIPIIRLVEFQSKKIEQIKKDLSDSGEKWSKFDCIIKDGKYLITLYQTDMEGKIIKTTSYIKD